MLVLIEDFGFGTDEKKSTRIYKFIERLQAMIDTRAEQYDNAIAVGLRNRLHNLGVEYAVEDSDNV